ncbi:MAG: HTH-type transcriptional activator IlvY [Desulfotalea sp.]|nr:MAG: HTH-type transcriptional activator IlvY [Desulfotalea sp.]
MNIRELELFRHLSSSLHFGKSALECNITPSGMTRTIQRLENEIGVPLFFRNNRTVTLTPAGILFKDYCDDTISRYQLFQNDLKSDAVLRGELTLYCSITAILSILPKIFQKYRTTHPYVSLHVQTGDAANALNMLRTREVDIAIAALPDQHFPEIEFLELTETPLLFISPKFFPETVCYTKDGIDWKKTPFIFPSKGLSRTRVETWFAEKGIRPYIYSQIAGNEAIISMVAMGAGVGIVPQLVLEKSGLKNEIEVLETSPRLKPFVVGACALAQSRENNLVRSFWSIVEREIVLRK